MAPLYIRNRREAEEVARLARVLGRYTCAQDIYKNSRFIIDIADRLFGDDPQKPAFVRAARQAVREIRAKRLVK